MNPLYQDWDLVYKVRQLRDEVEELKKQVAELHRLVDTAVAS